MRPTPHALVEFCWKLLDGKTIPPELRPEDHGRGYVVTMAEFIELQRLLGFLQPFREHTEHLQRPGNDARTTESGEKN